MSQEEAVEALNSIIEDINVNTVSHLPVPGYALTPPDTETTSCPISIQNTRRR